MAQYGSQIERQRPCLPLCGLESILERVTPNNWDTTDETLSESKIRILNTLECLLVHSLLTQRDFKYSLKHQWNSKHENDIIQVELC